MKIFQLLEDFIFTFFPPKCLGCKRYLYTSEDILCLHCISELPVLDAKRNQKIVREWLKDSKAIYTWAYLYFNKKGLVQQMVHALKYRGFQQVGSFIGKRLSKIISEENAKIDFVMSVPLHPNKLKKRGFNQVDVFAKTLATELGIEFLQLIKRVKNTQTQTKMTKQQRAENVRNAFSFMAENTLSSDLEKDSKNKYEGKHVLVVDDVLTTGATLESCAQILHNNGMKVSIAVIALAR